MVDACETLQHIFEMVSEGFVLFINNLKCASLPYLFPKRIEKRCEVACPRAGRGEFLMIISPTVTNY